MTYHSGASRRLRSLRSLLLPAMLLAPAGAVAMLWYSVMSAPPPGLAPRSQVREWGAARLGASRYIGLSVSRAQVVAANEGLKRRGLGHAVGVLSVPTLVTYQGRRGVLATGIATDGFFESPALLENPIELTRADRPFVFVSDSIVTAGSMNGGASIIVNGVAFVVRGYMQKGFRGLEGALSQHVWIPDKFAGLIDSSLPSSLDAPRSALFSGALLLPEGVELSPAVIGSIDTIPGYQSAPHIGERITGLGRATSIVVRDFAPLLLSGVTTLFVAAVVTLVLAGASETNATARATALRVALGAAAGDLLKDELERYVLLAPLLILSSVLFAVGGTLATAASLGVTSLVSWRVALVGVAIQCGLVALLIGVRLLIALATFRSVDLYSAVGRRDSFRTSTPLSGGPGLLLIAQGALSAGALLLVLPLLLSRGTDAVRDLARHWPSDLVVMHIAPVPGFTDRRVLDIATSARNAVRHSSVAQAVGITSWLPGVSGGGLVPVIHQHGNTVDSVRMQIVVADSVGLALTVATPTPVQYESESGPLLVNSAARAALRLPACGSTGLLRIGGLESQVRRVEHRCISAEHVPGSAGGQPMIATGSPSDFDGLSGALIVARLTPGSTLSDLDEVLAKAGVTEVGSPNFVSDTTHRARLSRLVLATLLLIGAVSGVAMLLSTARATGQLVADMQRSSLAVRFAVGAPIGALVWEVLRRPLQLVASGAIVGVTLVIALGEWRTDYATLSQAIGTASVVVIIFLVGALPQLFHLQRYSHTSVLQKDH